MRKQTLSAIAGLMILFFGVTFAPAQTAIDLDKMDRDMKIMENVLETVVDEGEVQGYFSASRIKGVYLDDFGVVFMLTISSRSQLFKEEQKARTAFEDLRTELTGFMLDYAGVIKQLKGSDRISIVANFSDNNTWRMPLFSEDKERDEFKPHSFMLSATKSAIDRGRTGSQNVEQFAGSVDFVPMGEEHTEYIAKDMQHDIRIMKSIFETALEGKLGVDFNTDRFQGTYLKDYGVLFVVNAGNIVRLAVPGRNDIFISGAARGATVEIAELQRDIVRVYSDRAKDLDEKDKERQKEYEERINTLIDALTEIIGDYGSTIRGLNANEKIAVLYASSSNYWSGSSGRVNLMLTASAGDIKDYSAGRIDLATFKTRITASTFE